VEGATAGAGVGVEGGAGAGGGAAAGGNGGGNGGNGLASGRHDGGQSGKGGRRPSDISVVVVADNTEGSVTRIWGQDRRSENGGGGGNGGEGNGHGGNAAVGGGHEGGAGNECKVDSSVVIPAVLLGSDLPVSSPPRSVSKADALLSDLVSQGGQGGQGGEGIGSDGKFTRSNSDRAVRYVGARETYHTLGVKQARLLSAELQKSMKLESNKFFLEVRWGGVGGGKKGAGVCAYVCIGTRVVVWGGVFVCIFILLVPWYTLFFGHSLTYTLAVSPRSAATHHQRTARSNPLSRMGKRRDTLLKSEETLASLRRSGRFFCVR
jgi:hypothetical protein